ncbi:damage-inducible protein [Rhizobium leguminosarum]|uniref:DEAD/DEAH box helicase n=1 Tax=Rhizobium leguminosarum TaxID=384 RepID=UPI001037E193|nr:type ISP restriction/modification enzyme [Rhizobium leguminosarum]TBG89600.1 damage-inducible protein [Rhizobium leguminosarum]
MSSALKDLFERYRSGSKSEREKGTYFENLAKVFFENDPQYVQRFDKVWTFADFARETGIGGQDTGIDLVARVRDDGGFCAIQCKFYKEGYRIQKADIDSFFTASGKRPFTERLIIDTTNADWSEHAEGALRDQSIETQRISLSDIEQSPIDWGVYIRDEKVVLATKKELRQHQKEALEAVRSGFAGADRGKLIMACGTGKTFTGLKIAEDYAGIGKMVLYLVPSLALMSQSVREWSIDTDTPLRCFAVCSDVQVGKRRNNNDDIGDIEIHDLAYPATTDAKALAEKVSAHPDLRMTVIFSTYQSIQTISNAQKKYGLPEFDLIICDEAHRTTGAKFEDEEDSNFVKVHSQDYIEGKKRLYMTATPRIYGDGVKTKASEASVELCSMDNVALYGETFFQRGFSWAVQNDLLTDYKVIVLAVDEAIVSAGVQNRLADANSELKLDDATKIIGCYKALSKTNLKQDVATDPHSMRRAIAFCRDIKSSKMITNEFGKVIEEYFDSRSIMDGDIAEESKLHCELEHVDGSYNAKARNTLLNWLKDDAAEDNCRILSNARCLSEGVDVPALDAIMFLHPRKSQIDVVQSVGRVMRRAPGKKMGYVILPVGIPSDMAPEEALNNNEKYKVVWQILNALRAHDDRFDATINKMELGVDVSGQIEIIAVTNDMPNRNKPEATGLGIGQGGDAKDEENPNDSTISEPVQTSFLFDEISSAIMAKIVKKCGRRTYWEDWATDIGRIAQTHITRIKALVKRPESSERKAFEEFLGELRDDLNDSISEDEAIEMLAQHVITKPVFEALFEGYNFTKENPVSRAMQGVLDVLDEHNLEKESESLRKFYADVKIRASGIDNAEGKQKIIVELYDKFFKNAFPKLQEKLGIVYTPVEVVDFIIHSVNDVLLQEFGQTLGSHGVHILDPFTGTGTFITRLLQSGLIKPEELAHKYAHEIHANEIVLLAYYIAAINIEAVYHSLAGGEYMPFEGICLTDTFQMYESDDLISHYMPDNSERRKRQKELDIRVIVGNPPYSAGQGSANDNNANIAYPVLDARIRGTYAAHSSATNKNALYDSYIRAMRWGSDRLGNAGVMAYVSNAGWIDGNAMDGLRKCLVDEFADLYIFHLRGNARTSGELRRKERDNVFGMGTRTPVAITLFVKNPNAERHGKIHLHDIGDYLTRSEKLAHVKALGSIKGISEQNSWDLVAPNQHHDWVGQRDESFAAFAPIGKKGGNFEDAIFEINSQGAQTARDAWCFNSSRAALEDNIRRLLATYDSECERYQKVGHQFDSAKARDQFVSSFVISDEKAISWSRSLKANVGRGRRIAFDPAKIVVSAYRPFFKQWVYFDRSLNEYVFKTPSMFPISNIENRVICTVGTGESQMFSALMVDAIPEFKTHYNGQNFPLKVFPEDSSASGGDEDEDLLSALTPEKLDYERDGISNYGLSLFQAAYPEEKITKDDIFYYVYGVLHSEDYRNRYADNLSKELPRIPCVRNSEDFWAFVQAGRALGELHVKYEAADAYPVTYKQGSLSLATIKDPQRFYRVEKMKYGGKRPHTDKATVVYNSNITMTGIPLEAYEYVVNGKPALEWVMERQCVKTDKDSGIVNDANRYAIETVGDPAYPLKLFQRVITVSLETMKIVKALPKLHI